MTSLHLNNTDLSDVVEIRDSLVGYLNYRVAVFDEDRVVLKASLRQLIIREESSLTAIGLFGDYLK